LNIASVRVEVVGVPDRPQRRVGGLLAGQDQRADLLAVVDRVDDRAAPVRDDQEAAHRRRDRHAELLDPLAALVVAQQQLVVRVLVVEPALESVDLVHLGGCERHSPPSGQRGRRKYVSAGSVTQPAARSVGGAS
jgi:hypothetical protein